MAKATQELTTQLSLQSINISDLTTARLTGCVMHCILCNVKALLILADVASRFQLFHIV